MGDSFRALCSDYYVNMRLKLKMDLPNQRDTVLSMFDRLRRELPWMDRFRRYHNELALESSLEDGCQQWVALRKTSVRSGAVNPEVYKDAYRLHRVLLETSPYFLDISPLDIDYVELLYGFDLMAGGNHDAIVMNALYGSSPMAALTELPGASPIECQPMVGVAFEGDDRVEASFEVKTRAKSAEPRGAEPRDEPISILLVMRRLGPLPEISILPTVLDDLMERGEALVDSRVVPNLLMPIRDTIVSGRFE